MHWICSFSLQAFKEDPLPSPYTHTHTPPARSSPHLLDVSTSQAHTIIPMSQMQKLSPRTVMAAATGREHMGVEERGSTRWEPGLTPYSPQPPTPPKDPGCVGPGMCIGGEVSLQGQM